MGWTRELQRVFEALKIFEKKKLQLHDFQLFTEKVFPKKSVDKTKNANFSVKY